MPEETLEELTLLDIHNDLLGIQDNISSLYSLVQGLPAGGGQVPDLTVIQESLSNIQISLSEKIYKDDFLLVSEKLDAITEELVKINEREDKRDEAAKAKEEAERLEAEETAKAAEELVEEPVPEPPDYTENFKLLADSLTEVNGNLENLLVYQQNQQNIQIPILCAVSLCFGGLLAVILSNYLKH